VSLIGPRRKSLNDCFQAMGITGRANLERQKSTQAVEKRIFRGRRADFGSQIVAGLRVIRALRPGLLAATIRHQ
jgi:hypothetical protein